MHNLPELLLEQVQFIRTSGSLVLDGNYREAVRVATAIRVICHNTKQSKSLLAHLDCLDPIMLSTGAIIGPNVIFGESGLTQLQVGPQGVGIRPALDKGPFKRFIPFNEWWKERVYVQNTLSLTRERLVLDASNKDGGAHVDAEVPENYETLKRGLWTAVNDQGPQTLEPQAMMTLVQIGHEVMNSPGIQKLIGYGPHVQS